MTDVGCIGAETDVGVRRGCGNVVGVHCEVAPTDVIDRALTIGPMRVPGWVEDKHIEHQDLVGIHSTVQSIC